MNPNMNIREAQKTDFEQLMALYRQLQPTDPVLDDGSDLSTFATILNDEKLHIYLLEVDAKVRSTCYLNIIPNLTRAASPYAVIENVVTDKDCRNLGFGRHTVEHALKQAWDLGCYKVMLQTGSTREETHRFYKKCGLSGDDKHAFIAWRPGYKRSIKEH